MRQAGTSAEASSGGLDTDVFYVPKQSSRLVIQQNCAAIGLIKIKFVRKTIMDLCKNTEERHSESVIPMRPSG